MVCGCGVVVFDPGGEVKEAKFEKGAGEEDAGGWSFALLACVTEERRAGPGMSGSC